MTKQGMGEIGQCSGKGLPGEGTLLAEQGDRESRDLKEVRWCGSLEERIPGKGSRQCPG